MVNHFTIICSLMTGIVASYNMTLDKRGPRCLWWWGWLLVAVVAFLSFMKWSIIYGPVK